MKYACAGWRSIIYFSHKVLGLYPFKKEFQKREDTILTYYLFEHILDTVSLFENNDLCQSMPECETIDI